ncbi:glycoside hydrolase family 28 protein [Lentzea tibetensis]|uniref:Glycoside hydrolase family 28 protein n=1 Tax=Lentzea tibetensis TaxID=2591470 RepID=A0A563EJR3_9PSEU|nr:glycoside hydrolase family 28 protein [Lentzea tibetensis]TWP47279.1 glycoside hydrolase family 28 protein [Lentzea tibetensis]
MATDHSRRDFIKVTGVAAGATLLSSSLLEAPALAAPAAPAPAETPVQAAASPWDAVPEILAKIKPPTFPDAKFDITAYGAKGDGKTKNTDAFRKAIEACNKAGGGQVVVPAGSFLTGAITLLSNVNLVVSQGATIKFSTDAKDFPMVFTRWQGIECMNFSSFIYARKADNIAITGSGTIDGQASSGPWFGYDGKRQPDWEQLQKWAVENKPIADRKFGMGHFLKPNMVTLYECKNILVEGVNLKNSAMWNIHPVLSTNVTVRNVFVYSRGAMVDGCDPEASQYVHITGCRFDCGDDGIAIKAGRDIDGRRVGVASENIVIDNCSFEGRWGALTVGSEMSGGVRNVFFQDCTVKKGSSYKPFHVLYIKTNKRRGGTVENIHARRIKATDVDREAIMVTLNYSLTGPGYGPIVNPKVQNITAENFTVNGVKKTAVTLDGLSESHIKNVAISNSTFTSVTTAKPSVKNADGTTFTNVTINGKPA